MRLLTESRTDERYVEAVRTWLAAPAGSWARHMGMFLLLFGAGAAWCTLVPNGFVRVIRPETHPQFPVSLFLAYRAGWSLALAGFCLRWARHLSRGPRLERLMIRYHDGIRERSHEAQTAEEITEDEWIGSAPSSLRSKVVRWIFRRDFALKARTDQECVALAREFVRRQKKLSFVLLPLAVMHLVICWMWLRFARSDLIAILGTTSWAGLTIGLALGLAGGLLMCYAIEYLMESRESLRHPRVARLMLTYHDVATSHKPPR